MGGGLKLYPKFLGPYQVKKIMRNDRYVVEKIGNHEGPIHTSSAADFMKPWAGDFNEENEWFSEEEWEDASETMRMQDGRV